MDCLWLRIQAPFAAFRGFQAGVYRATAPVIPPSAALGLILNVAGIEIRDGLDRPTTLIRKDIPRLRLAIGVPEESMSHGKGLYESDRETCTLYQQLHSYPVGNSGKELKERTHGAKYWIVPVRREFLVGFDVVLGVQGDAEILKQVVKGLAGDFNSTRYGLPFAGDNNFLFDRIDLLETPPLTHWYVQLQPDSSPMRGSYRLTVGIDRADNSKTTSFFYAPLAQPETTPPEEAWTWTPDSPIAQKDRTPSTL